jgi:hypothetical protein
MSSAIEAELAALYIMACKAVYIRIILKEMGHKQPPTPIQTDNAMAGAVISMAKSKPNEPKQWTCPSTGSAIENANNNSDSIGAQASEELHGLLDKTSLTEPSRPHAKRIFDTSHHLRNAKNETGNSKNRIGTWYLARV